MRGLSPLAHRSAGALGGAAGVLVGVLLALLAAATHETVLKITLLSEERIRVEDAAGPLTVMADSAEMTYSPFHMLASALATCVFSVLQSWASHARLAAEGLAVEVGWGFAERPHRVDRLAVTIAWPALPEERRAAAERAASLCAVHATLAHPPEIAVEIAR